ncbi:MAG TPA: hypothetical protein VKU03_07915, partial [Roseiarcus sp.]|nr:hypothetical protein [Roseiarcus sp.]
LRERAGVRASHPALADLLAAAHPHPALRATFSRKWEKGLGRCAAYVDTAFASANERRIAPLSRLRERAGVRASDAEVQSFSPPRTLIQRVVPFSRKREKDVAAVGDRGYSAPPANLG